MMKMNEKTANNSNNADQMGSLQNKNPCNMIRPPHTIGDRRKGNVEEMFAD
jgi:hypothetical protein